MENDVGLPFITTFEVNQDLDWQMSRAEKYCLIGLLEKLRPSTAIEIGTFRGGSLQVLSHFSNKVYSIDISAEPKGRLEPLFNNVEYIVGNSTEEIENLLSKIEISGERVDFIFVDGDHSKKGVYKDLNAILQYDHKNELTVLMHDSFNPQCRKGMEKAISENLDKVAYANLDYIGGSFWHNDTFREMWGGFALLKVGKGGNGNQIEQSLRKFHRSVYWHSIHLLKDRILFLGPVLKKFGLLKRKN